MDNELNIQGMEEADYLAALLLKQLRQEITEEELQYLENWKTGHISHRQVYDQINNADQLMADLIAMKQVDMDGWWQKISTQVNTVKKTIPFYRRWYTYAAAAVVLLVAGVVTWNQLSRPLPPPVNEIQPLSLADVKPGGNKAMLTVGDATIDLGDAANGTVARQGDWQMQKVHDDELQYVPAEGSMPVFNTPWNDLIIPQHTLSTPRGGQFALLLPDGTKAWLNAASSITYPSRFTTGERRVAITGEVYFEVANGMKSGNDKKELNGKVPFIVAVQSADGKKQAEVEVLGTKFNIMAYHDEAAIKTTLVHGKVKVSVPAATPGETGNFRSLAPGQQAQIPQRTATGGDAITVINVDDMDGALAWKNGYFPLKNSDIRTIMRMLQRWYNIEVGYEGNTPDYKFGGSIPRTENITAVIKTLEFAGVHFRIVQNKIIVLP